MQRARRSRESCACPMSLFAGNSCAAAVIPAGLSGLSLSLWQVHAGGGHSVVAANSPWCVAPRRMLSMDVHSTETQATKGTRIHIGEKAKLMIWAGTHSIQIATTCSVVPVYRSQDDHQGRRRHRNAKTTTGKLSVNPGVAVAVSQSWDCGRRKWLWRRAVGGGRPKRGTSSRHDSEYRCRPACTGRGWPPMKALKL
jgi:hypothetical protein